MLFQFKREISVGDLLTSIAIVISAVGLMIELGKERDLRKQQQANEIRAASAKTLAALERWRTVSLSFFDEIQPLLVESGRALEKKDSDDVAVTDFFYSKAYGYRTAIEQRLAAEKIETAYVDMYRFHPSIKPFISSVIQDLADTNRAVFLKFLDGNQFAIVSEKMKKEIPEDQDRDERVLNNMRLVAQRSKEELDDRVAKILRAPEAYLSAIVLKTDEELLDQANLKINLAAVSDMARSPFVPDQKLTPGAIRTTKVRLVCAPGYTRSLRDESNVLRGQIVRKYGFANSNEKYELDHLIPLSLGGADVQENLWPQSRETQPWNARLKDILELRLRKEVCTGRIPISQAQKELATDWTLAYRKYYGEPAAPGKSP
jgi:hypothetical protein